MREFLRKYIFVTSILVLMGCIVFGAARPDQSLAKTTTKKTMTAKKTTAKAKKKKAKAAKKSAAKTKKKTKAAKKTTRKTKTKKTAAAKKTTAKKTTAKKTTTVKKSAKKAKTKKSKKKKTAKKAKAKKTASTKKTVAKDTNNNTEAAVNPVANENTNSGESVKEPEANTSTNKTATAKDSKSKKADKKAAAAKSTDANREEFLEICQTMGENLNKKGFRYGWSSGARSYSAALKHNKVATCATYVSWCLQEYGVLKKGKLFYNKGGGVPNSKHFKSKKVKVVKIYKKTKNANLQPGDVICWASGKEHVCVYAGKNKKGKRTWYDAGRHQSTYGHCAGSRYKVVSARYNKYLENRLVGCVLRIQ
jgi:hypothetical protein